jgi:hypothetical protein
MEWPRTKVSNGHCAPQLPRTNPAWVRATELTAEMAVDTGAMLHYLAYLLIA